MDDNPGLDKVLSEVGASRRTFVKRVVATTAFAAPMIASYDLASLSPSVAEAAGNSTVTITLTTPRSTQP